MEVTDIKYHKWDFWVKENLKYVRPHFRMEKAARIVDDIVRGKECDLLDVGCGPAALMGLLGANVRYHGIDIAIQEPATNLLQMDFVERPIAFGGKRFDIIVAQGVFEYIGKVQAQKFAEIAELLKENGIFVVSYVNFDHRNKRVYWPYNNIRSFSDFHTSVEQHFRVRRVIPTSHRWFHDEPKGRFVKAVQMHINMNLPVISRMFAVEYFFICSLPGVGGGRVRTAVAR
jgi:SAM-dependent methyltransferase